MKNDEKNLTTPQKEDVNEEKLFDDYDTAWDEVDLDNPNIIFDNEDEKKTEEEVNKIVEGEEKKKDIVREAGGLEADEPKEEKDVSIEASDIPKGAIFIDEPIKFKGREIPIESKEEAYALMQKGFKLETEMAKIKPYKGYIRLIEDAGIDLEDLQAIADLKQGKKEAINYFTNKYGIELESFDFLDEKTKEYKPQVKEEVKEASDPISDFWNDVVETDPELAGKVASVYNELPDDFKAEVYKPEVFPAFVDSIKSGEFDRLYPVALKIKAVNPAVSWQDAYLMAYEKQGDENKEEQKSKEESDELNIPNADNEIKESQIDEYDRVWDDDDYFKQIEKEMFGNLF